MSPDYVSIKHDGIKYFHNNSDTLTLVCKPMGYVNQSIFFDKKQN